MKRKIEIHYEWFPFGNEKEINPLFSEFFEAEAKQQIITMMKKGYKMSELFTTFDGRKYKGCWLIKEKPMIKVSLKPSAP